MNSKFSQQQIAGINFYYSKILNGSFEEDDIRLLLIHLREFLMNTDNTLAIPAESANILRELGHSIAHTIRDKGEIYNRIKELVQKLSNANPDHDWTKIPFSLFDIDQIKDTFKDVLLKTGILYNSNGIEEAFQKHDLDLKLCLLNMLDGMIFKISYPESTKDFFTTKVAADHYINVRTELDLDFATSLRQIRLNALIPMPKGGTLAQPILLTELRDSAKVEMSAFNRIDSREGYCDSLKALRRNGVLVITKIASEVDSVEVYRILAAHCYDTHPIPRSIDYSLSTDSYNGGFLCIRLPRPLRELESAPHVEPQFAQSAATSGRRDH